MQAWEESGLGMSRRSRRDFDDFDEWDDDELGPDEESEFAVRYLEDEDEDDDDGGDDEEEEFAGTIPFEVDDEPLDQAWRPDE